MITFIDKMQKIILNLSDYLEIIYKFLRFNSKECYFGGIKPDIFLDIIG